MKVIYMALGFLAIVALFYVIYLTIYGLIRPYANNRLGEGRKVIAIRGSILMVVIYSVIYILSSILGNIREAEAKEEAEIKAMQAANAKARAEAAAKAAEDARNAALAREQAKTPEERIQELFSPWDGSAPVLVRATKAEMHDPDSFEHVDTTHVIENDGNVRVVMKFRGKNMLGATSMHIAVGKINPETKKLISFGIQ